MINTPANRGQNWEAMRQKARELIIKKINNMLKCDIEPMIEFEDFLDPVRIESFTGSTFGSLYGSSSNNMMSAFFRQANFSSNTKGLYFCGGSVHPGGGIPLCILGGNIASDIIIDKHYAKR
jgi:phytoene dehydrogenase-like protein